MTDLEDALNELKNTILSKPVKKQQILVQWIKKWCSFLRREGNFDPKLMPYYKRGDIVYADFGFNVGAEFGGIHYAVVIENNNNKANGNIVVVPLTSLDPDKSIDDIPKNDVYIGDNVIGWTNSATIAKPNQIRAISKMRINKQTTSRDRRATLTRAQMQLIENKLDTIIKEKQN